MKNLFIAFIGLLISLPALAQKPAYRIYDAKGKKVSYDKMLKALAKQDVVLFGELHNNPISHWLQLEVTMELDQKRDLALGAEMLEADNQEALDLYLRDSIDEEGLDTLARLWPNHPTDYAPLLRYAKEHAISFTACNVPRRFAKMVYRGGFDTLDSLSALERSWVAPLPIPYDSLLPTYQAILEMMGGHGTPNLVKAQAVKDATMAHFILHSFTKGQLFMHYNGAYHSDNFEGILWYLRQYTDQLKCATISTVSQEDICKLEDEHKGKADFIICVDSDMTTTY